MAVEYTTKMALMARPWADLQKHVAEKDMKKKNIQRVTDTARRRGAVAGELVGEIAAGSMAVMLGLAKRLLAS
jgi:galactokinase/mevalonate kinase-like predicted kinase